MTTRKGNFWKCAGSGGAVDSTLKSAPWQTLTQGLDEAEAVLARADALRLDLDGATQELADDGVAQFVTAFDALLTAVGERRGALMAAAE